MPKYSLKKAMFSKNTLLSEMAIITQTNFIDRIINILKKNPKVAGVEYSSYEDIVNSIESDDLNDKEKTLIREIIRCVNQTNLLNLTGKENKKARKQAEVLIIKQLRKYKNMDGEYINFKGILPMFDNIADFLEEKSDVVFEDCINAADLYMRNFYELASDEEKKTIDKGKYDFEEIFKKTRFYSDYIQIDFNAKSDVVQVYEDDDIKVVWPATPESFCQTLIDLGFSLDELSHCTRTASIWYKYHRNQYVAIAVPKRNLHRDDPEYFFSLKVDFQGEIDAYETCDRNNQHCNEDIIDDYFSSKAVEGVRQLPELAKNVSPAKEIDYDKYIRGFADLNDIKSLSTLFSKMFALLPYTEVFNKIQQLHNDKAIESSSLGQIVAESVSYQLFANPGLDTYEYTDLLNSSEYYPVDETLQYFKEKIVKSGTHPRYFNTLLELKKSGLDRLLSFEDVKNALESSTSSSNTANFKRLIASFLNNDDISYYLNAKSIANKTAGITQKNNQIYEVIYNSPSMNAYISQNKISTITHAANADLNDAKTFLSFLALRFTDDLVSKINKDSSGVQIGREDINNALFGAYLLEDLGPSGLLNRGFGVDRQKVFVESNLETYSKMRKQLFTDLSFASQVLEGMPLNVRQAMIMFICNSLKTNKNPLELEKNDKTLKILEKLLSFNDYNATFILDNVIYRLPYEMKKLTSSVKANINSIIFSDDSLRNNFTFISSLALAESNSRLKSHIFELILNLDAAKQQSIIAAIINKASKNYIILSITTIEKLIQKVNDIVLNLLDDTKVNALVNNIFKTNARGMKGLESQSRTFNLENIVTAVALSRCDSISDDVKKNIITALFKSYLTWVPESNFRDEIKFSSDIEQIDIQYAVSPEIISIISNESQIPSLTRQYLANKIFNTLLNKVFMGLHYNNLVIPKKILAAIFSSTEQERKTRPQRDLKANLLKNFINLSDNGENYLQGEELVIVRDALLNLLRKKEGTNFFREEGTKKFVIQCIMKLNPNARKHMSIVFPEMREELFDWTEEERAEIQADSLIRQYVKMLLS